MARPRGRSTDNATSDPPPRRPHPAPRRVGARRGHRRRPGSCSGRGGPPTIAGWDDHGRGKKKGVRLGGRSGGRDPRGARRKVGGAKGPRRDPLQDPGGGQGPVPGRREGGGSRTWCTETTGTTCRTVVHGHRSTKSSAYAVFGRMSAISCCVVPGQPPPPPPPPALEAARPAACHPLPPLALAPAPTPPGLAGRAPRRSRRGSWGAGRSPGAA